MKCLIKLLGHFPLEFSFFYSFEKLCTYSGYECIVVVFIENIFLYVPAGMGEGQGGLVCCDSWCRKESDTTE